MIRIPKYKKSKYFKVLVKLIFFLVLPFYFFKVIALYIFFYKKNVRRVAICITTTKGYFEKTIPILLEKFKNIGIKLEHIYVFEGGHESNRKINSEFNYYRVNNNTFELTSLIAINELHLYADYWLLLHDTLKPHWTFKYLLYSINLKGIECMPLRRISSMNIGIYSNKYIVENSKYLFSICNVDYSEYGLQKCKERCVNEEDFLFKKSRSKYFHPLLSYYESSKIVNYHNTKRKLEIYPQLGISKYKANSKRKEYYVVNI